MDLNDFYSSACTQHDFRAQHTSQEKNIHFATNSNSTSPVEKQGIDAQHAPNKHNLTRTDEKKLNSAVLERRNHFVGWCLKTIYSRADVDKQSISRAEVGKQYLALLIVSDKRIR